MEHLVSVDIGTTALKASIVRRDGKTIASSSHTYSLITNDREVEQDPGQWWAAFCLTMHDLMASCKHISVAAVVLSGQMQDLVAIKDGKALGNAILYSDTRAQEEAELLARAFPQGELANRSCNTPDAASVAPKILYAQSKLWGRSASGEVSPEPVPSGKATLRPLAGTPDLLLLGAHDYISWKLTGTAVTDYTNASTTGLMDYHSNTWNRSLLAYLGIEPSMLPSLQAACTASGTVTASAGRECTLPPGLPVIHGSGDAGASTVGVGAGIPGTASCYLGTSGWIAATVDEPCDPSKGIFNLRHPDGVHTIAIGAMRTTGGNLSWLMEIAELGDNPYPKASMLAMQAKVGAGGLVYLPYLQGERSPFNDPHARGAFIGLSRSSGKAELYRAVLEGICYALAGIHSALFPNYTGVGTGSGLEQAHVLIASGGGAQNIALTQILASVTGVPVVTVEDATNCGNLGNTIIAGKALGWFDSFALPPEFLKISRRIDPDLYQHELYQKYLESFVRIYQALTCEFDLLARISQHTPTKGERV